MEVVVHFQERSAGRGYNGLKEGVWRDRSGLEVEVVEEGSEEAELL